MCDYQTTSIQSMQATLNLEELLWVMEKITTITKLVLVYTFQIIFIVANLRGLSWSLEKHSQHNRHSEGSCEI